MRIDLSGGKALVTGGASGIGLATVEALLAAGAAVAVNFLPGDARAQATVAGMAEQGKAVHGVAGDVSSRAGAEAIVREAEARLGGLSILVNNAGTAGGTQPIPFPELGALDDAFWNAILSTNLMGPFWCSRAAAPNLARAGGCIVNTASIAGLGRRGSSIPYATSKAGLISLTRSLAIALSPDVRVNAVAPGFVETQWTSAWPQERMKAAQEASLLKRAATPQDVAVVILFLAMPGSYVNAQTIVVDGGQA